MGVFLPKKDHFSCSLHSSDASRVEALQALPLHVRISNSGIHVLIISRQPYGCYNKVLMSCENQLLLNCRRELQNAPHSTTWGLCRSSKLCLLPIVFHYNVYIQQVWAFKNQFLQWRRGRWGRERRWRDWEEGREGKFWLGFKNKIKQKQNRKKESVSSN